MSARIVVSAGSEPGKWENGRYRDSFSLSVHEPAAFINRQDVCLLSVHEPSAFLNRQDGCGLTERNFRGLEASAAFSILSQKDLQLLLLASLNLFLYISRVVL